MTDSRPNSGNTIVLFWLAWLVFVAAGQLLFVGYWHQDNNYGLRPEDYSFRTIDSIEFAALTPKQQERWDQIAGTDKYVRITIKNPFVFSHALGHLMPSLLFSIIALGSYLWSHVLPKRQTQLPKP